ncbi:MAG: MobA/MobL family protein, partial [Butyrivibrio sp.]|nr:MobA/MobL family protein [Butyrivibrio sp.]
KKTGQQKVDKRNRKQWKCQTVETTDWNSRENAKMWRKDLADTINATNEQLGIDLHWEHRSFKEQGIDREPTIHIGAIANALERKGVQTERGNINREIAKRNMMLEQAKEMLELAKQEVHSAQYAKIRNAAVSVKNEVLELIERVQGRMGRLALPIVSAKYLAKIPNRDKVQDISNAKDFLERNSITTFAQLDKFRTDKGKEFDRREQIFIPKWRRLEQLKELAKAYADYEPYKAVHDMSKSLSGLKKLKYDKEHEHELVMYENTRADLKTLLAEDEKITPKAWRTEREQLEKEMPTLRNERARECHDLAFAEVIGYNRANLERIEQNENRQQDRQKSVNKTVGKTKRREEEI